MAHLSRPLRLPLMLLAALTLTAAVALPPAWAPGGRLAATDAPAWASDTAHSHLGFSVPILRGLAAVDGKFGSFDVDLAYDPADPASAMLMVTIDAASIDTGIDKRDGHLRTPDFFDVEQYPQITYVSKAVRATDEGLAVTGALSLHGVTKDVGMDVTLAGERKDADGNLTALGFTGKLVVNRQDFGIDYVRRGTPDFIGDEITVTVRLLCLVPPDDEGRGR